MRNYFLFERESMQINTKPGGETIVKPAKREIKSLRKAQEVCGMVARLGIDDGVADKIGSDIEWLIGTLNGEDRNPDDPPRLIPSTPGKPY
jgi:hypothetical protein